MSSWQAAEEGECFDESPPTSSSVPISSNSTSSQQPPNNPPWGGSRGGGPPFNRGARGRGRHGRGFDPRGPVTRPFERASGGYGHPNSFNNNNNANVSNDSSPPRPYGMTYNRQRSNDWSNSGGRGFRGGGRGRGRGRGRGTWIPNNSHHNPHTSGGYVPPPQRDGGAFNESPRGGPGSGNIGSGNKGKHQWQRSSSVGSSGNFSDITPKGQKSSFGIDRVLSAPNLYQESRNAHHKEDTPTSPSKLPSFSSMASNFTSAEQLKSSSTGHGEGLTSHKLLSDKSKHNNVKYSVEIPSDEFGRTIQPPLSETDEKNKSPDNSKNQEIKESEISPKEKQQQSETQGPIAIPQKSRLTCSSLKSPDQIKKAEIIVIKMNKFMKDEEKSPNDNNSASNNDWISIDLPSKEQILNCLKQIESKIKENEDEYKNLESKVNSSNDVMSNIIEDIEEESKHVNEKEEARGKLVREVLLKREAALKVAQTEVKSKDMDSSITKSTNQVVASAPIESAFADSDAKKRMLEEKLVNINPSSMICRPDEYQQLICNIYNENKKRAQEAHNDVMSSMLPSLSEKGLENLKEKEMRRVLECSMEFNDGDAIDVSSFYTIAEWTQLTREVTGKSDALYLSPDCSPFYAINEASHTERKDLILAKVRSKKEKLRRRWEKLGYEYAAKQQLYDSLRTNHSNGMGNVSKSCDLQQSPSQQDDKGQPTHINPYRRPR